MCCVVSGILGILAQARKCGQEGQKGMRVRKESRSEGRRVRESGIFFLATAQGRGGKDSEFFRNENQGRGHFFCDNVGIFC